MSYSMEATLITITASKTSPGQSGKSSSCLPMLKYPYAYPGRKLKTKAYPILIPGELLPSSPGFDSTKGAMYVRTYS